MKELLNTIAGKLSGICKSVFVAHAKACIIAGSVVVAGSAATVTTVEYVHHHSSKMQVQAQETEVETETDSNLDKLSEILTETQTESETEIETATQEEIAELVKEAVADENTSSKELYEIIDKAAENSSAPIPVKDVEDLEIVEDNSSEPSREETEVEEPEPDQPSSNDVYEISQLTYGVDVSRWQGDIDWSAVAADGITFAMIKCGGGDDGIRMDTYPYADYDAMSNWMKELNEEYPNYNTVGETWVTEPAYTAWWQKDSKLSAPQNSNLKTVMDFSSPFRLIIFPVRMSFPCTLSFRISL